MSALWSLLVQYVPPGVFYAGSSFWQEKILGNRERNLEAQEKNLSNSLGTKIFHNILDYLHPSELSRCLRVSHHWQWTASSFPRQLTTRMIQKVVYEVLMIAGEGQGRNTDILSTAMRKFLMNHKSNFPLQIYPVSEFTSCISHDKAYASMRKKFAKFLEQTKWSVRRLLDFTLLKQMIVSNECTPGSRNWKTFQRFIDGLDIRTLGEILINAYKSTDPQDEYCFIVLLKMAFVQNWELPSPDLACKKTYLEKTILLQESTLNENPRFLELVLFKADKDNRRIFYEKIIDKSLFERSFATIVKKIPHSEWENKGRVILDFFETCPWNDSWAEVFQNACNYTQQIGACFKQFFEKDATPKIKAACLNKLVKLIPNSSEAFRYIFGQLHCPLLEDNPTDFPSCVRPLNFHREYPVIQCGDIYIGMTQQHNITALSAYNKKDERLLWELHSTDLFPETPVWPQNLFYCPRNNSDFALLHQHTSDLLLIDVGTGKIKQYVAMPAKYEIDVTKKDNRPLHFSPCGYAYYKTVLNNTPTLLCGEIDTAWQTCFNMPIKLALNGQEQFASFYEPLYFTWTIVDKIGATSFVSQCHDLRIKGNFMYTIGHTGRLTKHTLQASKDKFLPYGPKQSIRIRGLPFFCRILDICDDETVICSAEQGYRTRLYFVRFGFSPWKTLKQEIASFNPDYFVDTKNTVLWTWDKTKNELWTHTTSRSQKINHFKYKGNLRFLSVDHKNRLLCMRQ